MYTSFTTWYVFFFIALCIELYLHTCIFCLYVYTHASIEKVFNPTKKHTPYHNLDKMQLWCMEVK